jgi:hypothetical protein
LRRCKTRGMSLSLKCVTNKKYFTRRPSSNFMHITLMWKTSNFSTLSSGVVTCTNARSEIVERIRRLFTCNIGCMRISFKFQSRKVFPNRLLAGKRSNMSIT